VWGLVSVLFAFGGLRAQTPAWQPSPGHTQVPIWPGAVSDTQLVTQPAAAPEATTTDNSLIGGGRMLAVNNVTRPAMTVHSGSIPPFSPTTFLLLSGNTLLIRSGLASIR
jgi:hypothetical protein